MRIRRIIGLTLALGGLSCATAPTVEPKTVSVLREQDVTPVQSLVAFARLYGYVRFFHPTDAAAEADWQALAAQGAAYVRGAQTVGGLATRLQRFFLPLAPTLAVWVGSEPAPRRMPAPTGRARLLYWQYQGYVGAALGLFLPPYAKARVGSQGGRRRFTEAPAPDEMVRTDLIEGLHIRLPVVLSPAAARTKVTTRPALDPQLGRAATARKGVPPVDVRYGAIIEVWNILRHFYPYQSELVIDWGAVLQCGLRDAADDGTRADVVETLQRVVHAIQDGHGEVGDRSGRTQEGLPFVMELVQDRPIIIATSEADRFRVGDEVVTIDTVPALSLVEAHSQALSGSSQWRRHRAASWAAVRGRKDRKVEVTVDGIEGRRQLWASYSTAEPPLPPRPAQIHVFEDGVTYVDLTRASWEEIEQRLEQIAGAPGIVFDLRGYPNDNDRVIDHLLGVQESAQWLHVPRIVAPDGQVVAWHGIGWNRSPAQPHIGGEVVFLISAAAISYSESILNYVDAHGLGTLVGQATAGTTGDIVRIDTLGGFYVIFTGMRATRHDGSRFHLEGVVPNLEVWPSVAGLRRGEDEVLAAGLRSVRHAVAEGEAGLEASSDTESSKSSAKHGSNPQ